MWAGPPGDVLPGVVPVELVLGRSESAVVALTGMRAFPTGLAMTLHVRLHGSVRGFDLHAEVFDGPYRHDRGPEWQAGRLKWGFEFADGRRVTTVDPPTWSDTEDEASDFASYRPLASLVEPSRPILTPGGGGCGQRDADRGYWLWPLPPAGRLLVVCEWPARDIAQAVHEVDGSLLTDAAARATPLWGD